MTYDTSSDNKFNLSIIMTTVDNKIFFYDVINYSYKDNVTGYDNLITYLLSNDELALKRCENNSRSTTHFAMNC